jgi:hypothetical protein
VSSDELVHLDVGVLVVALAESASLDGLVPSDVVALAVVSDESVSSDASVR